MRYPGELMIVATIVLAAIAAGGYLLTIYNSLVALKNQIARSWANIDVLLKQRHDELPKLVSVCEGYMRHEREVFDKLSEARAALAQAKSLPERAQAESQLTAALGRVFAVAEAYPDLKANQNFLNLQEELTSAEDRVAYARQFYNDSVVSYNTRIQQFPYVILANSFNFERRELFDAAPEDTEPVQVRF